MAFTNPRAWSALDTPIVWVEFPHKDTGGSAKTYYWAPVELTDPSTYYGGYKERRLLSISELRQRLSDRAGQWRVGSCDLALSDFPDASGTMLLRGLLNDTDTMGLYNVETVVRLVTDAERRTATTPLTVFRGALSQYALAKDYQFAATVDDWFGTRAQQTVTPVRITATDFPNAPTHILDQERYASIIYGVVSDAGEAGQVGLCPLIPVGTFTALDATTWYGFVVAGHAIFSFDELWFTTNAGVHVQDTIDDVLWTAPGSAGFAALFGNKFYAGASGQWYTLIYGSAANPIAAGATTGGTPSWTLTANVHGIEDHGNAGGYFIPSIYDQIGHFADQWILPDTPYAGGIWASTPTWADGTDRRDTASFATVKTAAASLIPAGDDGAWLIQMPVVVQDLLAGLLVSGDCDAGFNGAGQLVLAIDGSSPVADYTEANEILQDSFSVSDDYTQLYNAVSGSFLPNYLQSYDPLEQVKVTNFQPNIALLQLDAVVEDATSQTRYRQRRAADPIGLIAKRDRTQTTQILQRRLDRTKNPPRTITFETGLTPLALPLTVGDTIRITHRQGATATGWTLTTAQVREIAFRPDTMTVQIVCAGLS